MSSKIFNPLMHNVPKWSDTTIKILSDHFGISCIKGLSLSIHQKMSTHQKKQKWKCLENEEFFLHIKNLIYYTI